MTIFMTMTIAKIKIRIMNMVAQNNRGIFRLILKIGFNTQYLTYLAILPSDLNLETGVEEMF
jgi:hypothetical protein